MNCNHVIMLTKYIFVNRLILQSVHDGETDPHLKAERLHNKTLTQLKS
jgi:hypothetical protein